MKKFRKVYIEITNICNMHCSFCPETKRAKTIMPSQRFEQIAKELRLYTDYVYLHVKGEPLLHPELEEILNICKKYDLKVNISTNGTLLKDKYELLKSVRQLNISLHSFENNDEVQSEEYLKNILEAAKFLLDSGVIIRYKLWNDANGKDNKKIIDLLEKHYDIAISKIDYTKDLKLKENVYLSIKAPFEWPDSNGQPVEEGTCYGLRQQIAILVDGTVVPCCVDNDGKIKLGNIFEESLEKILNSKEAVTIKKNFENNKCINDLCKKCQYRLYVT